MSGSAVQEFCTAHVCVHVYMAVRCGCRRGYERKSVAQHTISVPRGALRRATMSYLGSPPPLTPSAPHFHQSRQAPASPTPKEPPTLIAPAHLSTRCARRALSFVMTARLTGHNGVWPLVPSAWSR